MNLLDKLLLVLESGQPDPNGPLPYALWDTLRNEALIELRAISVASLERTLDGS